jgi:hypothetical protein
MKLQINEGLDETTLLRKGHPPEFLMALSARPQNLRAVIAIFAIVKWALMELRPVL